MGGQREVSTSAACGGGMPPPPKNKSKLAFSQCTSAGATDSPCNGEDERKAQAVA